MISSSNFSSAAWLRAFVVLACVTIIGVQGWRDFSSHEDALLEVEANMANVAQSMVQQAEYTFDMADTALVGILGRIRSNGLLDQPKANLNRALADHVAAMPRFRDLLVFDADGHLVASSLPAQPERDNASDRAYFLHHKASQDRLPYIGMPVRSQFHGQWVITVSRRITNPDGTFGGVVLAGVDSQSFAGSYAKFNVGKNGAAALLSRTGIMLARNPFDEDVVGKDFSDEGLFQRDLPRDTAGSYRFVSPVDGVSRISAYRTGDNYPIVTLAAADTAAALAGWWRDFAIRCGAIAVLVLTVGLLGSLLSRQLKRRQQVEAQIAVMAHTDGLTGLANRRAFDERMAHEWFRAARSKAPLSVLLIDVDHFKRFNDTYGHLAGDDALKAVAKAIGSFARRPGDLAARYGGEEFAFIAPETDQAGIARLAEEIRASVQALAIAHAANPDEQVLTISIGASTTAFPRNTEQAQANCVLKLADEALYKAKGNGRNSVMVLPLAA